MNECGPKLEREFRVGYETKARTVRQTTNQVVKSSRLCRFADRCDVNLPAPGARPIYLQEAIQYSAGRFAQSGCDGLHSEVELVGAAWVSIGVGHCTPDVCRTDAEAWLLPRKQAHIPSWSMRSPLACGRINPTASTKTKPHCLRNDTCYVEAVRCCVRRKQGRNVAFVTCVETRE